MQLALFVTECHRADRLDKIGVPQLTAYVASDVLLPPIAEYVLERRFSPVVWSQAARLRALRTVAAMEVEE
jgi:hypothetical protein